MMPKFTVKDLDRNSIITLFIIDKMKNKTCK